MPENSTKVSRLEQTFLGDIVTDTQSILNLWREHFPSLLNCSENERPEMVISKPKSMTIEKTFQYPTMTWLEGYYPFKEQKNG